jgi:hypothetical protein
MATIREERARLQFLEEHGRGDELAHVILIEEEARKRAENKGPNPKTRFVFETDDPTMYSRFNAQKDRWLKGRNKAVIVDLLCSLWEGVRDEEIERWASAQQLLEPEELSESLGDA